MINYKLFGPRVMVEVYRTPMETEGGLLCPVQKTTQQAKVRFVGDELQSLTAGDDILFDPYKGVKVGKYLLLDKEDVLVKIER
jgi:co-chaperonin GroES (HSP10)